jgi:hypothetical protein
MSATAAPLASLARGLLLTALALASIATARAELVLDFPAYQHIAHGAHGDIVLVAENDGGASLPPFVIRGEYWGKDEFTLSEAPGSQCGALQLTPPTASYLPATLRMDAPALAPGERRECRIRAQRHATPVYGNSSGILIWRTVDALNRPLARTTERWTLIGSYVDLRLGSQTTSFTRLPDGRAQTVHRITATNAGPDDMLWERIDTCDGIPPISVKLDVDIPGGCGATRQLCAYDFPGQAFELPEIPAGETRSCFVRLTTLEPYQSPLTQRFASDTSFGQRSGEMMRDVYMGDNTIRLVLGPEGVVPGNAVIPASGTVARGALLALLVALSAIALHRRRDGLR